MYDLGKHLSYAEVIENPRRRETLSVLMLCAPSHPRQQFPYHMKMTDFDYFRVLSVFLCVCETNWHKLRKAY